MPAKDPQQLGYKRNSSRVLPALRRLDAQYPRNFEPKFARFCDTPAPHFCTEDSTPKLTL
jgi:hypothetical protein